MARAKGKPFVYTPHAYYGPHSAVNAAFKAVWDRTAEKFLLERGAGTILLTDAWFGWLKERGISADRTVIIPNCVLGADLAAPPTPTGARDLPGRPAIITIGGASIPIPAGVAVINLNNDDIALQNDGSSRGQGKFFTLYGSGASAGAMSAWAWGALPSSHPPPRE